jgi:hypothetical protein
MVVISTSPVDPALVTQAVEFYHSLPDLAKGPDFYFDHEVMHWQVGTYEATSEEYNAETYLDDASSKWLFRITHDPRDNARTIQPGDNYAEHTYLRNSHGFGCAVAAMWDASPTDFGPDALQGHETEAFLAMCAAVAAKYNLDALDSNQLYTHAEAAIQDDYFPGDGDPDSRWDFARLNPGVGNPTVDEANQTAHDMRQRVHLYKVAVMEAIK